MDLKLKKITFNDQDIFIGLDVHKKTWHATIIFGEVIDQRSFEADEEQLYKYLIRNYPSANYHLAYEAGFTGFSTHRKLTALGINTIVVNPADIPSTDKFNRHKTDTIDSKKIAIALKNNMLRGIYIPKKEYVEARSLVRERKELCRQRTRAKNQIKSLLASYGKKPPSSIKENWSRNYFDWIREVEFETEYGKETLNFKIDNLDFINEQVRKANSKLKQLSKSHLFGTDYSLITTSPGIGLISGMTFLSETFDIRRFRGRDQLLSFIGIIPTERSSGESVKIGHLTKRGNNYLKNIIIEAAWVAVRRDPALAYHYNKYLNRMNSPKAIIKVARKYVSKIRAVLLYKQPYVKGVM